MTMASLSAALINRNSPRQVERKTGELVLLPPKAKAKPAKAEHAQSAGQAGAGQATRPISVTPAKGTGRKTAQTGKPARQRKTLRLMRETHRAVRALAKKRGVSQQSLMEAAVENMLQEADGGSARH